MSLRGIFPSLSLFNFQFFYDFDHNRLHNFSCLFYFIVHALNEIVMDDEQDNAFEMICQKCFFSYFIFHLISFSSNLIDSGEEEDEEEESIFNCNRASHFTSLLSCQHIYVIIK